MSQLDRTFDVQVFDKDRQRVGVVANPISVAATDRWLAQGTGELVVSANDDVVPDLLADGARVVLNVGPIDDDTFFPFMSGPLRHRQGDLMPNGQLVFQIEDDWRILRNSVARVVPSGDVKAASLTDLAQAWAVVAPATGTVTGASGRYQWASSPTVLPASTAVTSFLLDQIINRWNAILGAGALNIFDPSLGDDVRSILPQARMGTVEDYIVPLLEAGNVGLSVRAAVSTESSISFRFFEPVTWPQVFTPESGVVVGGTWSADPPSVTDVIAGGPGEEAARAFRASSDTDLVAQFGDIIEIFKDSTGAPIPWPSSVTDDLKVAMYYHLRPEVAPTDVATLEQFLANTISNALSDGAATAGIAPLIAETEAFHWGGLEGFHTGDIITLAPSQASAAKDLRFTDRITQTTLTQSLDKGFAAAPVVGTYTNDPDLQLNRYVKALADSYRRRAANQ